MQPRKIKCTIQQESFSLEQKGNKSPDTNSTGRVLKKACTKKHCNLCMKHTGGYTMHNTKDYHRYKKNGKENSDFCATKKGGKKPNPMKQSFLQLSKKIDKLKKTIKKQVPKRKKCCCSDSGSSLE
jgi:hypothetical protein